MPCGCNQIGRPAPNYVYEVLTDNQHFGTFDTPAEAREAQRTAPANAVMRSKRVPPKQE
jgi:hypothetical protein